MKNVCVLGNGQLGQMMRQAGELLGVNVYPIGVDAVPANVPYQDAAITAEIERWPITALTQALASHKNFVNRDVFPLLADRLSQKQLLDKLGLATAPWQALNHFEQWPHLFQNLGPLAFVKRRTGGYDGRGQWRITPETQRQLPPDVYGQCIVEQGINFDEEVSLVGARNQRGQCVFYPLTHNLHQDGILRASVAFSRPPLHLQSQAEHMLAAIMDELNYVGVMAMECFVIGDRLLINELAPRVHNSGHWTQNGASISQFELHLRAILDLPTPSPIVNGNAVMINLIGVAIDQRWLSVPLAQLHWYHKEIRHGRKLGHINLTHTENASLSAALASLRPLFSEDYRYCLRWAQQLLIN